LDAASASPPRGVQSNSFVRDTTMLRRFVSSGWSAFSASEIAAMEQLCTSHRQLLIDGGFADVRSEAGYTACAVFLTNIDKAAQTLSVDIAPRGYRSQFSANYRALFPDTARHYRVDVLEASIDQHSAIWVNGEKFELSAEAVNHAEALQQAWSDLAALLDRWHAARVAAPDSHRNSAPPGGPTRAELLTVFVALDTAWAQFEFKYISELIAIEEQARQLIVKAVRYDRELRSSGKGTPQYKEVERNLVKCLAHLNSVANFKGKGRDDLGCDILDSAVSVMQRCKKGHTNAPIRGAAREAAQVLASDVLAAFDAMRNYLFEVSKCMERVDPHLCNNVGLVARLVDWEESWEIGSRFVLDVAMFEAVCDLVAEVKAAQELAPALTTMCEDCDVELFLVLPRVVLLCFLADSANKRAEVVKSLLPHRFGITGEGALPGKLDPEFKALFEQFNQAVRVLENTRVATPAASKGAAWELLVKRAVLGGGDVRNLYGERSLATQKVVEDLMREVERWSLELQRHCPEDWNQFSAVLVQCLTGGSPKEPAPKFQV